MDKQNVHYFRLKFWPDRENRKCPTGAQFLEDEDNIYEMMKYRNEFRLYYLNWVDVWETYSYITRYYVLPAILVTWVLTGNWILGVSLVILWAWSKYYIIEKEKDILKTMGIFVPYLFDRKIVKIYGPQLPFRKN
jgi:hypothetical protein